MDMNAASLAELDFYRPLPEMAAELKLGTTTAHPGQTNAQVMALFEADRAAGRGDSGGGRRFARAAGAPRLLQPLRPALCPRTLSDQDLHDLRRPAGAERRGERAHRRGGGRGGRARRERAGRRLRGGAGRPVPRPLLRHHPDARPVGPARRAAQAAAVLHRLRLHHPAGPAGRLARGAAERVRRRSRPDLAAARHGGRGLLLRPAWRGRGAGRGDRLHGPRRPGGAPDLHRHLRDQPAGERRGAPLAPRPADLGPERAGEGGAAAAEC